MINVTTNSRNLIAYDILASRKEYDERKDISAAEVDKITVECDWATIEITGWTTNKVEAHFSGSVCSDAKLDFDITKSDREIKVKAMLCDSTININVKLQVKIPYKQLEEISVQSEHGDVNIEKVVSKLQSIKSVNGNISTDSCFEVVKAFTKNGNIQLEGYPKSDIQLELFTANGDIIMEFYNIRQCNLSTFALNGFVMKLFIPSKGYTATGNVTTENGNIKLA